MIFFQGILIGLAIAAPIGGMGLLCINKTLTQGKKDGLVAGLGIATGDFVYAVVAVFLYSYIALILNHYEKLFSFIGSAVLILLGLQIIFKKIDIEKSSSSVGTFFKTFLLTLSNPTTIISFVAIAASIATVNSWSLVCGIFFGSLLWWIVLTNTVSILRHKISKNSIKMINGISGITIVLFGLLNLWKLF